MPFLFGDKIARPEKVFFLWGYKALEGGLTGRRISLNCPFWFVTKKSTCEQACSQTLDFLFRDRRAQGWKK